MPPAFLAMTAKEEWHPRISLSTFLLVLQKFGEEEMMMAKEENYTRVIASLSRRKVWQSPDISANTR